ncbi:MAG: hypothetical protein M3Y87_18550, partial [Myxococcota bacterium]|nr:hypothetical protein [Myxococcota bacterium]
MKLVVADRRAAMAALTIVFAACGGEPPEGASDAAVDPPSVEPAPPLLTPCPEGWRMLDAHGLAACEPWPDDGAAPCPEGQHRPPGAAACA